MWKKSFVDDVTHWFCVAFFCCLFLFAFTYSKVKYPQTLDINRPVSQNSLFSKQFWMQGLEYLIASS